MIRLLGVFFAIGVVTVVNCSNDRSPTANIGPTPVVTPKGSLSTGPASGETTAVPGPTAVVGPRGMPAPDVFDVTWITGGSSYLPGDPISVKVVLRNVFDKPIRVEAFPQDVTLDQVDTAREEVAITQGIRGTIPDEVRPGEEVEVAIEIPSSSTASLVPGRYSVRLHGRFTYGDGFQGGGTLGWGSGVLFVVQPPQGAMEKTVAMGEVRESQGLRIELETVEFTPDKTTVVAMAVPSDYRPTAELAPVGAPHGATALYRLDDTPWQTTSGLGNQETAKGVRLEWTLGPIPSDARTFGFRVTSFMVNPSVTVTGVWEWSVPLQTNE